MYYLYLFEGTWNGRADHEAVVREVLKVHAMNHRIDVDIDNTNILKEEKGKPYLEGTPFHYNISHSKNLWACLVGDNPCGVDLQIELKYKYEEIAKKYFSEKEKKHVWLWGAHGFFKIWTRREAFGKMTGQGMFGDFPEFMGEGESFIDKGQFNGFDYKLKEVEIADDIYCVCCTEPDGEVEVIFLN